VSEEPPRPVEDLIRDTLLRARALVLRDLHEYGCSSATVVDIVEDAVAGRRWWVEQWPDGAAYVAGLVAQDVQEAMLASIGRWPVCPRHSPGEDPHELLVEPELGPEPHWVCPREGVAVARVGAL